MEHALLYQTARPLSVRDHGVGARRERGPGSDAHPPVLVDRYGARLVLGGRNTSPPTIMPCLPCRAMNPPLNTARKVGVVVGWHEAGAALGRNGLGLGLLSARYEHKRHAAQIHGDDGSEHEALERIGCTSARIMTASLGAVPSGKGAQRPVGRLGGALVHRGKAWRREAHGLGDRRRSLRGPGATAGCRAPSARAPVGDERTRGHRRGRPGPGRRLAAGCAAGGRGVDPRRCRALRSRAAPCSLGKPLALDPQAAAAQPRPTSTASPQPEIATCMTALDATHHRMATAVPSRRVGRPPEPPAPWLGARGHAVGSAVLRSPCLPGEGAPSSRARRPMASAARTKRAAARRSRKGRFLLGVLVVAALVYAAYSIPWWGSAGLCERTSEWCSSRPPRA